DGTFIPLPDDLSTTPFLKIWEDNVFKLLLDEGRITQDVIDQMRSWRHSGFSVDKSVSLAAGDTAGLERLAAYMVRCPISLDRIVSVSDGGQVVYRAEKAQCQPFPILGDARLFRGISRNFEVFDPLEFLAEITQHIPDPGMQLVRYYGQYSNKTRGLQARSRNDSTDAPEEILIDEEDTPYRKLARMRWGALLKRVFEINPLCCPKCGGEMQIVSFIGRRDQPDAVERILRHCDLWDRPASRAPPPQEPEQLTLELQYVDTDEFLMAL
ncbi:MAG: hypothetical protein HN742_07750, partial [Lentisphaerae bacterium]|nr:hypothetical protein [Lentisphaerota bacterium]